MTLTENSCGLSGGQGRSSLSKSGVA